VRVRGLDASSVQAKLPYDLISSEIVFVVLKAQQGNDGFDPKFEANMLGAIDAGIEPFAYCFIYPLPHIDPKEQARLFVERVHRFPQMRGKPIFLDCEWPEITAWLHWGCTGKQIGEYLRAVFEEVERLSGRAPVLYTYPSWWEALRAGGADLAWASKYFLWMASYPSGAKAGKWPLDTDEPRIPREWTTWLFWQFDGDGGLRLPNGVDSDFCLFNGDMMDLMTFANPPPPPRADQLEPEPAIVHRLPGSEE
jgi:GH25 family lysozyme M1 (1,4-beta-N-acetylmuramidase)